MEKFFLLVVGFSAQIGLVEGRRRLVGRSGVKGYSYRLGM